MLWLDSVVALSCFRRNCVGVPEAFVADMFTVTVPLIVLPFAGLVIAAEGGGGGALTVALPVAVAVRPAPSVTVRSSVCVPGGTALAFHAYVAVLPLATLCVDSVVVLSCFSTNWVGVPEAF